MGRAKEYVYTDSFFGAPVEWMNEFVSPEWCSNNTRREAMQCA